MSKVFRFLQERTNEKVTDVCILGGGLVGGILAITLARQGMSITLVDRESKDFLINPCVDGRTTSVNLASKFILENLGVWDTLAQHAEPILNIKVFEGGSPWSIHFDHHMISKNPMGYIIENYFIRQAIINQILKLPNITWYDQTCVLTKTLSTTQVKVYLDKGVEIKAALLVGAEGRNSPTRKEAGIRNSQISYQQKGLVFSVYHEKPHQGIAWEVFYPSGPLAFLPLQDCPLRRCHRSGVVWTLPVEEGDFWLSQENSIMAKKLGKLFGFLGDLEIGEQKEGYLLNAQMAHRFIDNRLVLIGDAAHAYHPVAGQGVNVGWRDGAVLNTHLQHARKLGLDLGSQTLLKAYQKERRLDAWSVFAMTDGMVRLFSNNSCVLHFLRNSGLGTVNRIPPLKRFLMRRAMGLL